MPPTTMSMPPPQTLSTQISAIDGAAVRERVKYDARCVRVFKAAPNTTTKRTLVVAAAAVRESE